MQPPNIINELDLLRRGDHRTDFDAFAFARAEKYSRFIVISQNLCMRYLSSQIKEDLAEKMVFLAGPRQVGKTTLGLSFLKPASEEHPAYLNWDFPPSRQKIKNLEFPSDQKIIILDEIHKFKRWRNLIKGAFDQYKNSLGHRMELRYLRDTDGREVDFIVTKDRKPLFAVECKLSKQSASAHLKYFCNRIKIPRSYQVFYDQQAYMKGNEKDGSAVISLVSLCEELDLV